MASTTATKTTRTRKPALPDVCRLTVYIRGVTYGARPIDGDGSGLRGWRLRNTANGMVYDVAETAFGPSCDCGDAIWRHEGTGTHCKHVRACIALGLIADTTPDGDVEGDPATWPAWTDEVAPAAG